MSLINVLNRYSATPKEAVEEMIQYINLYHKSNEEYILEIRQEKEEIQREFLEISLIFIKEYYIRNKNKKNENINFVRAYYYKYKNRIYEITNFSLYDTLIVRELLKQNKFDLNSLLYIMCFWIDEYYFRTFTRELDKKAI